jgi:hypothetical protein
LQRHHKLWRRGGNFVVDCPIRGGIEHLSPRLPSGVVECAAVESPSPPTAGACHRATARRHPGTACRPKRTEPRCRFDSGADRARLPHVIRFPNHAPFELEPTAHVE